MSTKDEQLKNKDISENSKEMKIDDKLKGKPEKTIDDTTLEMINKLKEELEATKKKSDENWDLLLRAKAEVENVRRRAKLDLENAHKYSIEKFAKEILNVVDSLERGIEIIDVEDVSLRAVKEGMELTYKLILDTLEKFGITVIDPKGEEFDPKKHEALTMQETDEVEPNKVLKVIQKGYMQHDRILRHAKVIVAKAKN